MALLQFGSIVNAARNSIGGVTYSQNRGGAYSKTKPIPTQPRTAAQRNVRANFGTNAKLWSGTLTDSQRSAWTFFAQGNPYSNIFGQSKILSGMAMMMKLNQVLAQISVTAILTPPSDLSVPALAAATGVEGTVSSGNIATLLVDTDAQSVVAGARYYIFATRALKAGKSAGTSDYRFIGFFPGVAAAADIDIVTPWSAVFGTAAALNTHVSVLVATVNHSSGALTPGLKFDTGLF